jgi:hypothetical protein
MRRINDLPWLLFHEGETLNSRCIIICQFKIPILLKMVSQQNWSFRPKILNWTLSIHWIFAVVLHNHELFSFGFWTHLPRFQTQQLIISDGPIPFSVSPNLFLVPYDVPVRDTPLVSGEAPRSDYHLRENWARCRVMTRFPRPLSRWLMTISWLRQTFRLMRLHVFLKRPHHRLLRATLFPIMLLCWQTPMERRTWSRAREQPHLHAAQGN